MGLRHVDLYITHTVKGMLADRAEYGYVLTYLKKNGELEPRYGYNSINEKITLNSIVLTAMEEALNRIKESVELNIYMDSQYIANMFELKLTDKWVENGFTNSKGGKIVDFPKWEKVLEHCKKHIVTVRCVQSHEFTMYLENEIRKIQEQKTK